MQYYIYIMQYYNVHTEKNKVTKEANAKAMSMTSTQLDIQEKIKHENIVLVYRV